MPHDSARRTIDVAAATIGKVLAAALLVWIALRLTRLLLLFIVAVFLAIALDPIVAWMSRHRVARPVGASVAGVGLVCIVVAFFVLTGSSLVQQADLLRSRVLAVEQDVLRRLPDDIARLLPMPGKQGAADASMIAQRALTVGRALLYAVLVGALALILMVYLLIEGRSTYEWLVAYVPRRHRAKVHRTAIEARRSVMAYVRGNVATSVFAGTFSLIVLASLHVPAALLLALLAAICDFIPVLGFALSAAPAILLALTVSAPVAFAVAALYAFYHFVENYYIAPKVYGNELRISNLAVLLAFAAGAEIGGVVGALIALPFAAMYPCVEDIWLRDYLAPESVDEHRRLEKQAQH